ncbi:dockerin type I repeat-containing protein [Lachnospiraceae bacterium 47-T17]
MKIIKKVAAGILGIVLCTGFSSGAVFAEEESGSPPAIRQEVDMSSCRQGDVITLSIYLKGSNETWEISDFKGILEYDNSLFSLGQADVLPAAGGQVSKKTFDSSSCEFSVTYDSDVTVSNNVPVVQLKLHVNEKATTGKTTVCVTYLEWQAFDGTGKSEVEHRVPSSITISEAEKPVAAGDVNLDGKVTLTDVKYIMQYCNGVKTLNSEQKTNADVNGDGKVTLADAKLIMKYCNNEISNF